MKDRTVMPAEEQKLRTAYNTTEKIHAAARRKQSTARARFEDAEDALHTATVETREAARRKKAALDSLIAYHGKTTEPRRKRGIVAEAIEDALKL
jgi:hypothetical protein